MAIAISCLGNFLLLDLSNGRIALSCRLVQRIQDLMERVQQSSSHITLIVVGGGAGGTELAFSLHHRLSSLVRKPSSGTESTGGPAPLGGASQGGASEGSSWFTVKLIARHNILPSHPAKARRVFLDAAQRRGIQVIEGSAVASVEPGRLYLANGKEHAFDECLWCTQAAPASWLDGVDLPKGSMLLFRDTC